MFVRVFEYTAAPGQAKSFEAVYGPDGDSARLFAVADGYLGTTLEGDGKGTYRTHDFWTDREAFDHFLDRTRETYEDLGRRFESLKATERHLGDFDEAMPRTTEWRVVR